MFIPVSINTGLTTVSCVATATGDLTADCEVLYKSASYQPNVAIPVVKGDTIQLRTNVTGPAQIVVELGDRTYYWHVDLPKTLRYVEDLAFQRVTGSVYGKLYSFPSNTQQTYVETGTLSKNEDILASIDYQKKEIWLFGSLGAVKKITTPEKPVAVVFLPRWSIDEDVATTPYVVTESKVYALTDDMSLDIAGGVVIATGPLVNGACADASGIVFVTNTYVGRIIPGQGATQLTNTGGSSVQVTFDNKIVLGRNDGFISIFTQSGASYSEEIVFTERKLPNGSVIGVNTKYLLDVNHAEYVFAIDMVNRKVISIKLDDKTVNQLNLDFVPSSIVSEKDSVYVSFFDHTKAFKYGVDLTGLEEVNSVKTHGSSFLTEFMATDLYEDATDVTKAEDSTAIRFNQHDIGVDETSLTATWIVPWTRPQYIRLITPGATATLDDQPFTEGYVVSPSQLVVSMPNDGEYYAESQVDLMGYRPVSIHFRTEPKLFPNSVTLNTVYEAFIRRQYDDIFQVEGMTDGFSVQVGTDSGDMEFSINDAPYAKTGTIKNGDVVEVRAVIKNMITKRNQHDIMTEFGMPVSLWTILVMQLNGASFRPDTTLEKHKFDVVRQEESATEEHTVEPQISIAAPQMLSTDTYAPLVSASYMCEGDVECNHWDSNVVMQGSLVQSLSGTTRILEQSTSSSVAGTTRSVEHGYEAVIAYSDSSYDSPLLRMEATFREGEKSFLYDADYLVSVSLAVSEYASDTERRAGVSVSVQDNVFYLTRDASKYTLDAETFRYVSMSSIAYQYDYLREHAAHTIGIDAEYVRRLSASLEFAATVDRFYSNPTVDLNAVYEKTLLPTQVEHVSDYEALIRSRHYATESPTQLLANITYADHSAEGRVLYGPTYGEFGSDMDVNGQQTYVDFTAVGIVNTSTETFASNIVMFSQHESILVPMPVREWVVDTHQELSLEADQSGFFDTLEDAQAYAATLNLELNTPAQFKQYGDKWILVSAPVADNAACFPTTAPPSSQRRFGYAGGG